MNLKQIIEESESLDELHKLCALPEPYDDRGYFFIYYAEADYRQALSDVIAFIDGGMRIFYDRKLERGAARINDYVMKCKSLHCRCVVFYLSENVFCDETFLTLCETVYRNCIPYISVNIPGRSGILSGELMLKACAAELSEERKAIIRKLFSNEIIYVPYTFSVNEKQLSLEKAHSKPLFTYSINGDYAVIERIRDVTVEEVTIPEKVLIGETEYTVKAIAPYAFSMCKNMTRITFPPTLESVGVGNSVEDSGRVFNECKSLKEIVFPDSVKFLAGGCFTGCTSLERLILNDNLQFKSGNLYDLLCFDSLEMRQDEEDRPQDDGEHIVAEIKLPACVRKVGEDKFIIVSQDAEFVIELPEAEKLWGFTEQKIGREFYVEPCADISYLRGMNEIESVTFAPDWYDTGLYDYFEECVNLKEVNFPDVCYFLDGTFNGCVALEKITLPQSLVQIGSETFAGCINLREIVLPENVVKVNNDAFEGCDNLKTLTVENENCKKLLKGGLQIRFNPSVTPADKLENFIGVIKLPFFILFHFAMFIALIRQKAFYYYTGIEEIYVKRKCRIKGFKLTESDKNGYFKYIRKSR